MARINPVAAYPSPANFTRPLNTGRYQAAPFVSASPNLSAATRNPGAISSLAAPVVSAPTYLSGVSTTPAQTIQSMTRAPATVLSTPGATTISAQTLPSMARAPSAVVSTPQAMPSQPLQTNRAAKVISSSPTQRLSTTTPVQAAVIGSATQVPVGVSGTPVKAAVIGSATQVPVGISGTAAKVISSAPMGALETTAIKSVVGATKTISREEMIAKGILIQSGAPSSAVPVAEVVPAMVQEVPDVAVTEEMQVPPMAEGIPDYIAVFQGLKDAPVYESHHFNSLKWASIQPRADDIIIVTAYKSGTTWMQQIVSEILFQGQEKPATVGDMSPWVDLRVPPAEVLGPMVEDQTWRRFLKTHMPADAFLPYFQQENKYIYVARDGRDAFMSMMNHYEKGNDQWYGALNMSPGLVGDPLPNWAEVGGDVPALFDAWMSQGWHTHPDETDGWPFWSYFKNVKTWWELAFNFGQSNIYFVHFNNMKNDLEGEMRKIAEFLEVPVNEEGWASCVLACTFDEMHKNAEVVAPLNGALWEGGAKSFIFKGTNERWRGVLSDEQIAAYEAKAMQELGEDCARFMATGAL